MSHIDNDTVTARLIAYYLPQFHPTTENDAWWGPGFTEWTNVGKAKPLFKGHYQPRVPADLGYYDLRLPEVRAKQAALAKEAGIEGFMYWHYWFGNGRRMLDMPFNEVLNSKEPDFPFCLGWANHSWRSDSWKNKAKSVGTPEMLIEQLYPGIEDIDTHFYTLLPAFLDKRYITVNNKPLFQVYDPLKVPDCQKFIERWQELAIKNGLPGIHFVGLAKGWSAEVDKILELGFDASNRNGQWEAESIVKGKYVRILKNRIADYLGGAVLDKYDYNDIVQHLFSDYEVKNNVYPTILSNWDRSARSGRQAVIYVNSEPAAFGKHIEKALELVKEKPFENRIIFLKSWNEWGEGNYVEPDLKYGMGYLNAIKQLLKK